MWISLAPYITELKIVTYIMNLFIFIQKTSW